MQTPQVGHSVPALYQRGVGTTLHHNGTIILTVLKFEYKHLYKTTVTVTVYLKSEQLLLFAFAHYDTAHF